MRIDHFSGEIVGKVVYPGNQIGTGSEAIEAMEYAQM